MISVCVVITLWLNSPLRSCLYLLPIAARSGSCSNQGRILCDRKKHHPCRRGGGEVLPQDWPPEQHGNRDHAGVSIWMTGL